MREPAKPYSPSSLSFGESVRLALAASLSLGLSLALFDLIASVLRDKPRAFESLFGILPPLSMSIPAFFLPSLVIVMVVALAPLPRGGRFKGPLVVSLAAALGIGLVLAEFYNLFPPRPTPAPTRTLFLTVSLALALGSMKFLGLRAAWTGPGVPREIRATLLASPLVLGIGLLFLWARAFRSEIVPGRSPSLWNLAVGVALALAVTFSVFLAGRIRIEIWLGAAALLLSASGALAVLAAGPRKTAGTPPAVQHTIRHIIFLSIDTLRYDAISALRSVAPPTPSLDSLAADSVIFTRAYSPAPWTLPTFSTMMTGVTPLVHGVRKFEDRIPAVLPTLAERMSRSGYTTAAFGDQLFLHPQHGIARGFDSYQLSPRDEYGASLGARIMGKAFPKRYKPMLNTGEITDLAVDWLREHARDDFFLWIHYFKPHGPYEPLPRYRPKGEPPSGMGFTFSSDNAIRSGSLVITATQRPWVRQLYEGELRYVDDNVGRLLSELKSLGIYDGALIVFVSDHGEEFWDHDGRAHGHTFYDELLHVPLFVKLPGESLRERRGELVCTGSIYSTMLDLAGVPHKPEVLSYAPLTPLLGGAGGPYQEAPVLSSTPLYFEDRESIVFGDTKYIVSLVTNREQLFDLKGDPREQHDLAGAPSELLTRARAELEAARKSSAAVREHYGIQAESSPPLSPETLEQLRSLGYVH